jgi:hypothetical protein
VPATSSLSLQTNATLSGTHVSTTYHVPRGAFLKEVNEELWENLETVETIYPIFLVISCDIAAGYNFSLY